jgi:transposase
VDETTLGLHPVLAACWMKRGTQRRIPTPGTPQWHHLFGAYNYVTDEIVAMAAPHKNSNAFVAFLDMLVQQVTDDRPIIVVLDNASYHHSHITQAGFAAFEARLLPLFLPAYCSTLNPIERYWRHLKTLSCANRLFPSMSTLVHSVLLNLKQQNDHHNLNRFTIRKNLFVST